MFAISTVTARGCHMDSITGLTVLMCEAVFVALSKNSSAMAFATVLTFW